MPRLIAVAILMLALSGCAQAVAVKTVVDKVDVTKWVVAYKIVCNSRYDTEMKGIGEVGVSPGELRAFCRRTAGLSR